MKMRSIHDQWSSRLAFILAATGSAVGLGNIWKFPYMAGQNGGGAVVLIYLACIFLVGIPIMIAEVMLGRRARQNPINAMATLAEQENRNPGWKLVGWSGTLAGFIIFSFYSVISGWVLYYVFLSLDHGFSSLSMEESQSLFQKMVADPYGLIACHTLFAAMTLGVVAHGIQRGLERAVKVLMPGLLLLLLLLLGYSMSYGSFGEALRFLFQPDWDHLSGQSVLAALGQAFFTLSLASGAIMVYGSYLPSDTSIPRTCIIVALCDTVIALLSGLVIFPIVFAQGMAPASGPGLIFQTLPVAFGAMPGGQWFAFLFFILFVFAAWTSSISMVEPGVSWLVENHGWTRPQASVMIGFGGWLVGLGTVFSFNVWQEFTVLGKTFFECLDYLTSNLMLPLGGMAIAIFACWKLSVNSTRNELDLPGPFEFNLWRRVTGFLAPIAVLFVCLNSLGVF
jgi:NSS family neurotransmitter:Na+ symporter